ncbi:hypothetical protein KP509_32G048900 [Ceratopteris richardii]|uniref:Uncharacterized protein n=1 Tax=Ceratopteris richardii TaxID=49495 RepID=A0A8T2QTS4_CERRI|nr:hypothetical protein KP509_32G048900 [Ceratopteris richardii]
MEARGSFLLMALLLLQLRLYTDVEFSQAAGARAGGPLNRGRKLMGDYMGDYAPVHNQNRLFCSPPPPGIPKHDHHETVVAAHTP